MKRFYLTRKPREKFLVLLMLVVALVIWGSLFSERLGGVMADNHRLNRLHADFRVYLDNQEIIRDRAQEGIRNLDPARTLDGTRLWGEVGALARKHGLNPSVDSPRTEPGDVFSYHTLVLSVSEADLPSLINFTGELQTRAPYVALEQVIITSRSNPMLLDARYRISSVELN
jgi:hypothetical protein